MNRREFMKARHGGVKESSHIRWNITPMNTGESLLQSQDRRWTIIQGQDHFTLLEHGAAVYRCSSQDGAVKEAARRAGLI